jgi:hypothetical protein
MKRLQPGMLALIINDEFSENLGRVVIVEDFYGPVSDSYYGQKFDDGWNVRVYHNEPLKVINTDTGEIGYSIGGVTSEKFLSPLEDEDIQFVKREAEQGACL